MAKVTITLEDSGNGVDFGVDMPELKSEQDVTQAIIVAFSMIEYASAKFAPPTDDYSGDADGERLEG